MRKTTRVPLARKLDLPLLTLYGLGTLVGGGFYALLGKVAGEAGMHTPVAFLTAAIIAGFSGLSFGELAARYPFSAGESHYVQEAFGRPSLSIAVGWLVALTGIVSAAMLANAFVGFLQDLVSIPSSISVTLIVLVLGGVAIWGIGESVILAVVITFVEVGGLLFVVYAGRNQILALPDRFVELAPPISPALWPGIVFGAFLAFYSLIGFEDMVNVAEEVKNPRKTLPLAIMLAITATTILYVCVSVVAVLAVGPDGLGSSRTPLAVVLRASGYESTLAMSITSMLAGTNGALVQIIMASRIVYGMSSKGMAPGYFERVSPRTRTPIRATMLIIALVLVFALWLPLVTLARLTSGAILGIFALVNLSLVVVKLKAPPPPPEVPVRPLFVPIGGCVLSVSFVVVQLSAL